MKPTLEDIVSLAKRRGFVFPSSDIYGGLSGVYDYGPLGVRLKHNIENLFWNSFVAAWDDMYPMDSAILGPEKVFEASGHLAGFNDPLVVCSNCHGQSRADHIKDDKCPHCGKTDTLGPARQFNMMLQTQLGAVEGDGQAAYLRPETAQGIFTNFKNVVDTFSPDMPFGMAQIGKAFRNEISPRDFLFRLREMEQMEIEYFCHPDNWQKDFEEWIAGCQSFFKKIGLPEASVHQLEVPEADRAHYSKRTIDFEFDFPFGKAELAGLAYRGDYDLQKHQKASGKNLEYRPKDGGDPFIPHVIEPSFGLDRLILAVLTAAYSEDTVGGDPSTGSGQEKRTFLKLSPEIAPVKVAVLPLVKNKPELTKKAVEVYNKLRESHGLPVMPEPRSSMSEVAWVDTGNIGKNYRKMDEIGCPVCITVDFQTLEDDTVTVRNRDTTEQTRQKISQLKIE